mmetsp:Transcript_3743/g.12117  ORF Transcript_3743/g.12117 Transcript_3743/m.12117 type:complete len:324 (+) Transcript_3743:1310-2281(+)
MGSDGWSRVKADNSMPAEERRMSKTLLCEVLRMAAYSDSMLSIVLTDWRRESMRGAATTRTTPPNVTTQMVTRSAYSRSAVRRRAIDQGAARKKSKVHTYTMRWKRVRTLTRSMFSRSPARSSSVTNELPNAYTAPTTVANSRKRKISQPKAVCANSWPLSPRRNNDASVTRTVRSNVAEGCMSASAANLYASQMLPDVCGSGYANVCRSCTLPLILGTRPRRSTKVGCMCAPPPPATTNRGDWRAGYSCTEKLCRSPAITSTRRSRTASSRRSRCGASPAFRSRSQKGRWPVRMRLVSSGSWSSATRSESTSGQHASSVSSK